MTATVTVMMTKMMIVKIATSLMTILTIVTSSLMWCQFATLLGLHSPGGAESEQNGSLTCTCSDMTQPLQVLVGERGGRLRFYRVDTGDALRCLEVPMSLMSAHWCPSDPLLVGAVAGTHWFVWDTSRSR